MTETGFAKQFWASCTDLFENLSVNSLKRYLSNYITLFSLVNTFNKGLYIETTHELIPVLKYHIKITVIQILKACPLSIQNTVVHFQILKIYFSYQTIKQIKARDCYGIERTSFSSLHKFS